MGEGRIPGSRRRPVLLAVLAAAVLVAGSCGDDEEPVSQGATTTQATEGTTSGSQTSGSTESAGGTASEVDLDSLCDAYLAAEAAFVAGPEVADGQQPTPEALQQFSEEVLPLVDELEAQAPEELSSELGSVLGTVREALESGDPAGTQTPEFQQAEGRVEQFLFENCELDESAEIAAVEYEFQGVPETVSAGRVGLRLDNQGQEVHEAVIFRIKEGEERSLQELVELPEDEGAEAVEFKAFTVAGPGEASATIMDLEPGRYGVLCFIPVGTTSLEQLEGLGEGEGDTESGPPHFTQGMASEFTVE